MISRPAPTYEGGLAIPPRKIDCIQNEGFNCPIAEKIGNCFTDWHHLYFEKEVYLADDGIYRELYKDENSKVRMARCRHNSSSPKAWHSQYGGVEFPEEDYAIGYLDESAILHQLGIKVRDMSQLATKLISEDPRKRITPGEDPQEYIDRFRMVKSEYKELWPKVKTIEVMPRTIVGRAIKRITDQKRQIPDISSLAA